SVRLICSLSGARRMDCFMTCVLSWWFLVVVCVVAVIVYCWPSLPRTESNRDHAIPDGIERGKEGKGQYRANGCASDQHIRHRSPEHGVRERDKCKHRGQCRQDDRA